MAFKKRRMMLLPEVNPKSFIFFFERGNSGTSWSIRDYSVRNRVKEYGPRDFRWTADDVHERAVHSIDAPTVSTDDLAYWHDFTLKCNTQYLRNSVSAMATPGPTGVPEGSRSAHANPNVNMPVVSNPSVSVPASAPRPTASSYPILNLPELLKSPKGRKTQDMERILHSANSEDWVTWNFFQIMFRQYSTGWWKHLVSEAGQRNPQVQLPVSDRSLPVASLWSCVSAPSEYESRSRARMQSANNREWNLRASNPEPVEGPSEIDVIFSHD